MREANRLGKGLTGKTLGECAMKGELVVGVMKVGAKCPDCGCMAVFTDIKTKLHFCDECGWEGYCNEENIPRKNRL